MPEVMNWTSVVDKINTVSAVWIIILLQPWLGASKASKYVLNLLLLGYGADTDVLIVATTEVQFSTSGIELMIYGLYLHASSKSFIPLLVTDTSFDPEKCKYLPFLLAFSDTVSS